MPFEREAIREALKKKGFREESGDHFFYTFWNKGKRTAIFTKLSHGTKYRTYGDFLIGAVCRSLNLTKKEFGELVSCTLTEAGYVGILEQRGKI
jgi:hypothetical protein